MYSYSFVQKSPPLLSNKGIDTPYYKISMEFLEPAIRIMGCRIYIIQDVNINKKEPIYCIFSCINGRKINIFYIFAKRLNLRQSIDKRIRFYIIIQH